MSVLLTALQAAQLLGKAPRTASRRAREAYAAGDPEVIRIGQAWAAPEDWWRTHLEARPRGRPIIPHAHFSVHPADHPADHPSDERQVQQGDSSYKS